MGFKSSSSAALLLSLNLFFFTCALAYTPYYKTTDIPDTPTSYSTKPTPSPVNTAHFYRKHTPSPVNTAHFYHKHTPILTIPAPFYPTPTLTPPSPALSNLGQPTPSHTDCSTDTLNLGVCARFLNGQNNLARPCCLVFVRLFDPQVSVCLCTSLKANVLGINLDVNVALSVIANTCGETIPPGFKCY